MDLLNFSMTNDYINIYDIKNVSHLKMYSVADEMQKVTRDA